MSAPSYKSPGQSSSSLYLDQIRTFQREVERLSRPGTSLTDITRWFTDREAELTSLNDHLESIHDDSDADVILEECKSLRMQLNTLQKKHCKDRQSRSGKAGKSNVQTVRFEEMPGEEEEERANEKLLAQQKIIKNQENIIAELEEKLKETLSKLQQAYQHVYKTRPDDSKSFELIDKLRAAEDQIAQQKSDFEHKIATLQGNFEREKQLMQEFYENTKTGNKDNLEIRQLLKEKTNLLNQTQERLTKETQINQEIRLKLDFEAKKALENEQIAINLRQKVEELTLKETQLVHKNEILQQKLVFQK